MGGYAASSRLRGAVPRFAGASPGIGGGTASHPRDSLARGSRPAGTDSTVPAGTEPPVADQIELVGRPIGEAICDWLASIGESWSQTTFYLFDPDSWR